MQKNFIESIEEISKSQENFTDIGIANIDHQREKIKGVAEVIYGESKTQEQLLEILEKMQDKENVLVTRLNEEKIKSIACKFENIRVNKDAKTVVLNPNTDKKYYGKVLILSAGTSDIYAVEEAKETLLVTGVEVECANDVGVAGIHRLFAKMDKINQADVIIVCAGMEGALVSVVAGLTSSPVIGLPTSVGYGASFGGVSALLTMLNSCASGVTVVNIDNGFGAGFAAYEMIKMANKLNEKKEKDK